jgi:membrane protein YqaA with SNARE-associated domain
MVGLKHAVRFVFMATIVLASSLLIYLYYGELSHFFLRANPFHRGPVIFLLCFLGATSIVFPVPYTAVILCLSARIRELNILEIALWGGFGSGAGEFVGWLLGRSFEAQVHDSKYGKKLRAFSKLASSGKGRWLIPIVIWIFAFTPLPDDVVFIALGAMNYSLIKAIIPCIAGKVAMLYTIGLFGQILGSSVSMLPDWVSVILALALIVAFLIAIEVVDWEALIERISK